jgi:hypothetical protein
VGFNDALYPAVQKQKKRVVIFHPPTSLGLKRHAGQLLPVMHMQGWKGQRGTWRPALDCHKVCRTVGMNECMQAHLDMGAAPARLPACSQPGQCAGSDQSPTCRQNIEKW